MSFLGFILEVSVLGGGRKLSFLWLYHGATLQSSDEATVDIHCKTVCFNQLLSNRNKFNIVFSKIDSCFNVTLFLFYEIH